MLDLGELEPLELVGVGDVDAVLDGAGEAERVEELAAGVALLAGEVGEVLGGARPGGGPLDGLRVRVEEVHPPLRLHPPHEQQLRAEEGAEGEGRDGARVGASLEPRDAAPRLPDEDAQHGSHRPPPVDQLRLAVPLEERRVLAQAQRVEAEVAGEPARKITASVPASLCLTQARKVGKEEETERCDLRAIEPRRVDELGVALEGGDPRLLGGGRGDDERAARRGPGGDGGGIGERAPGPEERGLEHGRGGGGGGGRERHGLAW